MGAASDLVATLLPLAKLPLAAMGLGTARGIGMLQILPLSNRLGLRGMHRTAVAVALAFLMLPMVMGQLAPGDLVEGRLLLLTVKEVLVGLVLGTLFAVPFWAAEAAGELIDNQRGSRSAVVPDAAGEEEGGLTATLLVLTLATIFFLSGGMHWLIDALASSYRFWPASEPIPSFAPDAIMRPLELLDRIMRAGLLLASPLLIVMVLSELALALVSRFAPQLNVFDLAMSMKGLIYVIGMPVYAVFLIGYFQSGLGDLLNIQGALRIWSGR